jgi:hypothetical protein
VTVAIIVGPCPVVSSGRHLFQQSTLRDAGRSKLHLIEMTHGVGVDRTRDGGLVRAGGVDDLDVGIFNPERAVRVRFSFPVHPA